VGSEIYPVYGHEPDFQGRVGYDRRPLRAAFRVMDAPALEGTFARRIPGFHRGFDFYRPFRALHPDFSTAVVEVAVLTNNTVRLRRTYD